MLRCTYQKSRYLQQIRANNKCEMILIVTLQERYGILLEGYLRSCGKHRTELLKQHQVLKDLYTVAMAVKNATPTDRKKALQDGLSMVLHILNIIHLLCLCMI